MAKAEPSCPRSRFRPLPDHPTGRSALKCRAPRPGYRPRMHSDSGPGEQPDTPDFRTDAQLLSAHVTEIGTHSPSWCPATTAGSTGSRRALPQPRGRERSDAGCTARGSPVRGSVRDDAAVGGWLHRIVVNACRDQLRRSKRDSTNIPVDDSCAVPDRTSQVDTAVVVRNAPMQLPRRAARRRCSRRHAGLLGGRYRRAARCRPGHSEEPPRQGACPARSDSRSPQPRLLASAGNVIGTLSGGHTPANQVADRMYRHGHV